MGLGRDQHARTQTHMRAHRHIHRPANMRHNGEGVQCPVMSLPPPLTHTPPTPPATSTGMEVKSISLETVLVFLLFMRLGKQPPSPVPYEHEYALHKSYVFLLLSSNVLCFFIQATKILTGLIPFDNVKVDCVPLSKTHYEHLYIFAVMWSVGAFLELSDRFRLEDFIRGNPDFHLDLPEIPANSESTIFDYFVSKDGELFFHNIVRVYQ